MRILAISGVPGVGKSFLMKLLLAKLKGCLGEAAQARMGLVDYLDFGSVAVLGKYAEGDAFGGTDRLAMNVQEDAVRFMYKAEMEYEAVCFEGDRLCNAKYLKACNDYGSLRLIVLTVPPVVLAARRYGRNNEVGKAQNPTWLKGRESKVANLSNEFMTEEVDVSTDAAAQAAADELSTWLLKRS